MVLDTLVESLGGISALVKLLKEAGHDCQYAKIHQITSGKRPMSMLLAIQIEDATNGEFQALDLVNDSLAYWRKNKGIKNHAPL
jgi:hypothetical protein